MSTIKISQLPVIGVEIANTSNTILLGVDLLNDYTGQLTATSLASGLYSNNPLAVGNNNIVFPNTVAQFSGNVASYMQINQQNFNSVGTSDYIITADTGTNTGGYLDLGINNSQWNAAAVGQTSQYPLDGYLVVDGPGSLPTGNLVIGTANPGTNLVFMVGGYAATNIPAVMTPNGLVMNTATHLTFADGTVLASANTNTLSAAFNEANTANVLATSAFNLAYTAIQNTASIVIPGNVAMYGTLTNYGNTVLNGTITTNGNITMTGTLINNGSTYNNGITYLNGQLLPNTPGVSLGSANAPFQNIYTSNSTVVLANANVNISGTLDANGSVIFQNPQANTLIGAVEIIGSNGSAYIPTNSVGTMLHITGQDGISSKITVDTFGTGASGFYAARTGRGTAAAPLPSQAGDFLLKISALGYAAANGFDGTTSAGGASINFRTDDNVTNTTRGASIVFATTPVGSNVQGLALTISGNTSTFANNVVITNNTTANVIIANSISVTANVSTGNVSGTTGTFTNVLGTLQTAAQPNITSVGTLGSLSVTGNTTTGNISVSGVANVGSLIIMGNENDAGTITTSNTISNTYIYGSATAAPVVTQLTSRSTSVTANGTSGQIIGYSGAAWTHQTGYVFTVNNSSVLHASDIVFVSVQNSNCPLPQVSVANTRVGSFDVAIFNAAGAGNDASYTMNLNFGIIRVGS
jgi:hypothetical protein